MTIMPFAAAASGSTPSVTFTGKPLLNLGTLSCPSTPDVSHITLTGGSIVTFINHLGRDAVLHVAGQQLDVADQASVPVTFRDGTYTAEMDPDCTLNAASPGQVTVDVKLAAALPIAASVMTHPAAATGAGSGGGTTQHLVGAQHLLGAQPTPTADKTAKAVPSQPATAGAGLQPQTIGKSPGYVTVNNRDVMEMLVVVMGLVAFFAALCAYYMRKIHLRMPRRGGDNGDGDRGARDVPEGQAAQIFQLARRIGQRDDVRGGRNSA